MRLVTFGMNFRGARLLPRCHLCIRVFYWGGLPRVGQGLLDHIVPVIITYNEAPNIARALHSLEWAHRVVVLDSGSTDDTETIACAYRNVHWFIRPFDDHARQCNYALKELVTDAQWVLFMDADYVVTPELRDAIGALVPKAGITGFTVPFRYCINGVPLRGTLYPPRVCLFRPKLGRYLQFGHMHWLEVEGSVASLASPMLHDDRKPTANFVARQRRYARLEAEYLWAQSWAALNWRKRIRRLVCIAPWAAPLFALFGKGVVLDGGPGLKYAWERAQAEYLIAVALLREMLINRKRRTE